MRGSKKNEKRVDFADDVNRKRLNVYADEYDLYRVVHVRHYRQCRHANEPHVKCECRKQQTNKPSECE